MATEKTCIPKFRLLCCVLFAVLGLNRVPLWGTAVISFGSGILCAIIVRLFVVPWQRKRIRSESICSVTLPDFSGDPRLFCFCCLGDALKG